MSFSKRDLDSACDVVEQVLRERRAPAMAVGGHVLPTFIELLFRPLGSTRFTQIKNLREDIALSLTVPAVRVAQRDGFIAVQFDLPSGHRQIVRLDSLVQRAGQQAPYTMILGLCEQGIPLLARLSDPAASHILIAGATGSGKTVLAQSIIASLTQAHDPREFGVVVVDPKRGPARDGFLARIQRHILMNAATAEESITAIEKVVQVMRKRQVGAAKPRVLVYIDEAATVCDLGGARVTDALKEIAQFGREMGIHALVCTQKPSAKALDSLIKSNLPMRLVGSVTSARDATLAAGISETGAERLSGAGAFLCVAGGRVVRFQGAVS